MLVLQARSCAIASPFIAAFVGERIMDMKRYLRRWLNDAELRKRPNDRYEGVISEVLEERLKNKFTGTNEPQPVIVFEDGYRLVPNIGMRQGLIEFWGSD